MIREITFDYPISNPIKTIAAGLIMYWGIGAAVAVFISLAAYLSGYSKVSGIVLAVAAWAAFGTVITQKFLRTFKTVLLTNTAMKVISARGDQSDLVPYSEVLAIRAKPGGNIKKLVIQITTKKSFSFGRSFQFSLKDNHHLWWTKWALLENSNYQTLFAKIKQANAAVKEEFDLHLT